MESKTGSADSGSAEDASAEPRRPTPLDDEDALDAFVADADAAVVEFYTDGCGICASMEPVLGNVARELDVAVATVNPRDDPPLVERFDVRSVPLFVLFVDGEPVARRADGFIPGDDLTAWIADRVA
ncbi:MULTISPECIES: thioredoxin family protein [Halorubrum]|uniref:Thiol reductase thioredoxin n=1 Tax=Halorubrum persicum TaxID=1383844 RepID=A0A2G1WL49_9EURY|nr:thioredoxin family protein [Halorubrum persicum]PHQ39721.1 thiol reductase thioredoxin [Halorubrum persicum]